MMCAGQRHRVAAPAVPVGRARARIVRNPLDRASEADAAGRWPVLRNHSGRAGGIGAYAV